MSVWWALNVRTRAEYRRVRGAVPQGRQQTTSNQRQGDRGTEKLDWLSIHLLLTSTAISPILTSQCLDPYCSPSTHDYAMARILGSDLSTTRSQSSKGESVSTTTPLSHAREVALRHSANAVSSEFLILPQALAPTARHPRPRSHANGPPALRTAALQAVSNKSAFTQKAAETPASPPVRIDPAVVSPLDSIASDRPQQAPLEDSSADEHHPDHPDDSCAEVSLTLRVLPGTPSESGDSPFVALINPWESSDESATESEDEIAQEERAVLAALESMGTPSSVSAAETTHMSIPSTNTKHGSSTSSSLASSARTRSSASSGHPVARGGGHHFEARTGTDETMATSLFPSLAVGEASQQAKSPVESVRPLPSSPTKAKQLIAMFEQSAAEPGSRSEGPLTFRRNETNAAHSASAVKGPRLLRPSDQCGTSPVPSQGSVSPAGKASPSARALTNPRGPQGQSREPHNEAATSKSRPSSGYERGSSPTSSRPRALAHSRTKSSPGPGGEGGQRLARTPSSQVSLSLPIADLLPEPPRPGSPVRELSSSPVRRVSRPQSLSYRSTGGTAELDVGAAAKARQEGRIWYYDVHRPESEWVRAQALLFPSSLALSWIPRGGGRQNIVLDLSKCREVHSLPSVDHSGTTEGDTLQTARGQGLASMKPFQFVFEDGVERMAVDSIRERAQWVAASRDVLSEARTGHSPSTPIATPLMQQSPRIATRSRSRSPSASKQTSPRSPRSQGQQTHSSDPQLQRIGAAWAAPSVQGRESQGRVPSTNPSLSPYPGTVSGEFGQIQSVSKTFATQVKAGVQAQSLRPVMGSLLYVAEPSRDRSLPLTPVSQGRPLPPARKRERGGADALVAPRYPSASPRPSDNISIRFPSGSALTLGGGDELCPDDSASQRPPRSEVDERVELPERLTSLHRSPPAGVLPLQIRVGQIVPPEVLKVTSAVKTPAQVFRDSVMEDTLRKTVVQDAPSPPVQPQIPSAAPSPVVSQSAKRMSTVVEETTTQAERAAASSSRRVISPAASREIAAPVTNKEEVSQVLRYLDEERRSQASRDRAIEESLSQLRDKIEAVQKGSSAGGHSDGGLAKRLSDSAPVLPSRSDLSDASFLKLQEKLDRVMELVQEVSERSEKGSATRDQEAESAAELKHIASVVDELLDRARTQSIAGVDEAARSIRAPSQIIDEAFSSKRPASAASVALSDYATAYPDTAARVSRPASQASRASALTLPPKDWSSANGVPATPVNTLRETQTGSLHSQKSLSIANPDGLETLSVWQERDIVAPGDDAAPSTLDMQAAVEERRRVRQALEKDGERSGSILARAATVEDAPEVTSNRGDPEVDQPPVPAKDVSRAPSVAGEAAKEDVVEIDLQAKVYPELIALQAALKEMEEARQGQQRQQNDIARYLNQLNEWLEKDVVERQKELKTLSDAVSKLSVDVNAARDAVVDSATRQQHSGQAAPNAAQDGQWPFRVPPQTVAADEAPAASWPFKAPPGAVAPVDEDVDREGLTGVEADAARVHALHAAHDEVVSHVGSVNPADAVAAEEAEPPLSEQAVSELGDAAAKKNPGKIRKIVREAAKTGAGMAALAALMKIFHHEKKVEHEAGDQQEGEVGAVQTNNEGQQEGEAAGLVENVIEKMAGPKAAKVFESLAHGKEIIHALKEGKYDEVLHLLSKLRKDKPEAATGPSGAAENVGGAATAGDAAHVGFAEAAMAAAAGAAAVAAVPVALSHANEALDAIKEGKLTEALQALKEGHFTEALHDLGRHEDADAPSSGTHKFADALKHGAMGAVGGAVLATAIEELLKHHKAKEEQEKLKQAEAERREAEKEAARLAAERAREEQMTALQQQHSAAIINALAEMVSGACKL
ncbi:hypothetical protein BCV69DRAFT_10211 [Microstroma glucosiphilum]|uniref:PH domain-containing protein n=1 Tax=Pseudomicrostroma glucosiphilum TaxID=1684307 RepID=A0A316UHG9_9BASI|nr:hypothetical protein BCV69DRAFT_10211 [Pseudomicrostroma glucosiphilum]PWN23781.1 hypothetical protein BCV69DRAFT_10211 [Pseudomicrostroma glucosiphilum]